MRINTFDITHFSKQNKQVVLLYGATIGGVLLGFISSIVNTRFINPVDYGNVRYVQNIINFISSLLLFGYFLSGSRLLAVSNDEKYSSRVRGAMLIILACCGVFLMLSTLSCYFIHYNKPEFSYLFLISIPFCCNTLFSNYINTTAQGDNHIGRLAFCRFVPALVYVPTAFLVYKYTGSSATKMILLQNGLSVFFLVGLIISTRPAFTNLKPIFNDLNKENKDYGFQLYVGSLVMVATNYLAGISLGNFNTDNVEVGFFTLSQTVTSPLALLPSIIGTTYFKKFASEPKIPDKVMRWTLIITAGSCIAFILLIRPMVTYLYSSSYSKVGVYASWLSVSYCIHGVGDMMNRYLGSHGKGKEIRNASIANGVFKLFGFTVLIYFFNTSGAIITQIFCSTLYTCIIFYYYKRIISK